MPKALNLFVGLPVGGCRVHGAAKIGGNCQSKAHITPIPLLILPERPGCKAKDCAKVRGDMVLDEPTVSSVKWLSRANSA
jgi:hypothetical protein